MSEEEIEDIVSRTMNRASETEDGIPFVEDVRYLDGLNLMEINGREDGEDFLALMSVRLQDGEDYEIVVAFSVNPGSDDTFKVQGDWQTPIDWHSFEVLFEEEDYEGIVDEIAGYDWVDLDRFF